MIPIVGGAIAIAVFRTAVVGDTFAQHLRGIIGAVVLTVDDAIAVVVKLAAIIIYRMSLRAWFEPFLIDCRGIFEISRELFQLGGVGTFVTLIRYPVMIAVGSKQGSG